MEKVFDVYNQQEIDKSEARQGFTIRNSIREIIRRKVPEFGDNDWISLSDLNAAKLQYLREFGGDSDGKTIIEQSIADSVAKHEFLSVKYIDETKEITLVDALANFASSWGFLFFFLGFIGLWFYLNTKGNLRVDTFPFNFLDLMVGIIATIQALLILISQKRQSDRDSKLSLKNEYELSVIREKIDHIINIQNPHIHESLNILEDSIEELNSSVKKLV